MAIETFVTIRQAKLYKSTGRETDMRVPASTRLDCDWEWPAGTTLEGKRKVIKPPEYANYFVNSADLETPTVPPPPPTLPPAPDEVVHRWHDSAGHLVMEQTYIKKP